MAQVDDVLAPGYLEGLEEWPLDAVRARREEATQVETGLSFLRRIVQGKLDIVMAEQARRRRGEQAGDLSALVERLPSILGDRVHAPGLGRLPATMEPGEPEPALAERLEAVLPSVRMGSLPEMSDEELARVAEDLDELERSVSAKRRAVFEVIDRVQEEIVRRYRSGEAAVDSLLP